MVNIDFEQVSEKRKNLLRILQNQIPNIYPAINLLETYSGFREFRLHSLITQGNPSDYEIFKNYCDDRHGGVVIPPLAPMFAQYLAIAKKGEYPKSVSERLVSRGVIELDDILGGYRTPSSAKDMAHETILLGLDGCSLVVSLSVFASSGLKSLDYILRGLSLIQL